ncbi:hypothetical protein GCM10010129_61650 [Streptomyces fumigatiscleroticus]|nr:hypothetical protein GCM10010129_61650 [Streptomyces fumigatiscleroticus]
MRERPDAVDGTSAAEEVKRKRIDLSVPQVAGSALAAVVAAKLASYFGVYGTILGAGVVSAVATCGGTLFQHFFKRTGEQIRDVTVAARPKAQAAKEAERRSGQPEPVAPGEYTAGTVYRARAGGRRRPVIAAALVFGVTMAGITTYELVSGNAFGGGQGTTVGDALTGHNKSSSSGSGDSSGSEDSGGTGVSGSPGDGPTAAPSGTPAGTGSATPSDGATAPDGGGGTTDSATSAPDDGAEQESDGTAGPSATPSASATAPEPSASSRSRTADQGQDGSGAP